MPKILPTENNRRNKPASADHSPYFKRSGRPPHSQIGVIRVLKQHPELWNKPIMVASLMHSDKSFEKTTPKAVSAAISKIRMKRDGSLDIGSICEGCLGTIVIAEGSELVCQACGRCYGQVQVSTANDHSECVNEVWRAYKSNERLTGLSGSSSQISHEASRIHQFGQGVKGNLTERSLSVLAEVFKAHPELGQNATDSIARLVIQKCEVRSQQIRRVGKGDAIDCVTLALYDFGKKMPVLKDKMGQIIEELHIFFPDVAVRVPKSSKSPKLGGLGLN